MNKSKIWLSSMGGSEQKYIQEAFDTNWIAQLVQILMLSLENAI
jgi:hypothetical protein